MPIVGGFALAYVAACLPRVLARKAKPSMTYRSRYASSGADRLARRIREAENELFAGLGVDVDEFYMQLARTRVRVRVLAHGSGPPLVLLHGVSLSAAAWAPLFSALSGWRVTSVDLPGHGLSDPIHYRHGEVRRDAHELIDDILDGLELDEAPVLGHSLGGMFALWHVAAGSERISGMVALGEPAVALPGVRVRMPLSLLTVRGLGTMVLRSPSPRRVYRCLLAQGLGSAEVAGAPESLLEALRLSARRPENARTVASLMHAINRFRRPRTESVLTCAQLAAIPGPVMFILGSDDPYLSPTDARPSIDLIPSASLYEVSAGHAPWLANAEQTAALLATHFSVLPGPDNSITALRESDRA
jgi:pimeloyl-ACP methyl ester carboxylesterase